MRLGKLTTEELQSIIVGQIKPHRIETITGSGIAVDCATMRLNGDILITTDPITTAGVAIGKLALYISSNDIAASGGEPIAAMLTILLPPNACADDVKLIVKQAEEAASELNIDIVGGHTEFTSAVVRTIVSCTMLGNLVVPQSIDNIKSGDRILMTKYAALEATSIIVNDYKDRIFGVLNEAELVEAHNMLNSLSVLPESRIARDYSCYMHDITEGGVFGAVAELAEARGLGATIDSDSVPIHEVTAKIVKACNLNPYKLISSGSLIIITRDINLVNMINEAGILCTDIGSFNESGELYARGTKYNGAFSVTADEILEMEDKQ